MFKKNAPNAITCGNLLCGCLAIVKCFEGNLVLAAYLVGIAAVLDFFDGFVARILKVNSPIGKDLDSLADMVTFGVVPGVMMFEITGGGYLSFIITIFSAIRLAKFNNDTRQSESFIGLPTPANAILICSIPLINKFQNELIQTQYEIIDTPLFFPILICILSFLLIAPIPLFALKFKNFKWKENEIRYVFLITSLLLLVFLKFIGIPLIIISYILFSFINNILKKN